MRRTVRLVTLPLNRAKRDQIAGLERAYAEAKDRFLVLLAPTSKWRYLANKRGFRDFAKAEGFYPKDMNVHLVDQAAFDAVDTWVRHIESVVATSDLKARISRRFSGERRHYAYSLLKSYADVGSILRGEAPERPKITLSDTERACVCRFLHRRLRDAFEKAGNPWARLNRSFSLDEMMYSTWVVEQEQGRPARRQYVEIVGPEKNKRIVLPLAGISRVSGNIRVVMDEGSERAFVHVAYEITPLEKATGPKKALDWGITEVATDEDGARYGEGYGRALQGISDANTGKGRRRGKIWSLTKAEAEPKKARRIAKRNLGTKKQARRREGGQASLRTITGAALKEIVYGEGNHTRARGAVPQHPGERPSLIVHEDLSHLRGKARSKKLSRLASAWMRSELEGRMTVHAYRGCSPTKAVNAAYTSQTCPEPGCGYVSSENRNGDGFHCRNPHWDCGRQGGADQVAAMNLASRASDHEITLFTPHTEVRRILEVKFQRRTESRTGGASVPSGTAGNGVRTRIAEGMATTHGRTPSRPRRHQSDVGGAGNAGADSRSPVHTARTGETQRLESEKKRNA